MVKPHFYGGELIGKDQECTPLRSYKKPRRRAIKNGANMRLAKKLAARVVVKAKKWR